MRGQDGQFQPKIIPRLELEAALAASTSYYGASLVLNCHHCTVRKSMAHYGITTQPAHWKKMRPKPTGPPKKRGYSAESIVRRAIKEAGSVDLEDVCYGVDRILGDKAFGIKVSEVRELIQKVAG